MGGKKGEHVIEEGDTAVDIAFTLSIQAEFQRNIRFLRLSFYFGRTPRLLVHKSTLCKYPYDKNQLTLLGF